MIVRQVIPGTPAEKAGLKKNDVIVKFAGKDVGGDADKFAEAVNAREGRREGGRGRSSARARRRRSRASSCPKPTRSGGSRSGRAAKAGSTSSRASSSSIRRVRAGRLPVPLPGRGRQADEVREDVGPGVERRVRDRRHAKSDMRYRVSGPWPTARRARRGSHHGREEERRRVQVGERGRRRSTGRPCGSCSAASAAGGRAEGGCEAKRPGVCPAAFVFRIGALLVGRLQLRRRPSASRPARGDRGVGRDEGAGSLLRVGRNDRHFAEVLPLPPATRYTLRTVPLHPGVQPGVTSITNPLVAVVLPDRAAELRERTGRGFGPNACRDGRMRSRLRLLHPHLGFEPVDLRVESGMGRAARPWRGRRRRCPTPSSGRSARGRP